MSETVIIDTEVIPSVERTYELTKENVAGFNGEARELADDYLIPFLFSGFPANFRRGDDADLVRTRTRRLLSVGAKKFENEDEFKFFKKHMKKLFTTIKNEDVLSSVDRNDTLKSSKDVFGQERTKKEKDEDGKVNVVLDTSKNLLYDNLKGKKFRELTEPAKLGAAYTGGTEKGMAFRGKLERGVEPKDLIDQKKLLENTKLAKNEKKATYTIEMKEYYRELFKTMGMDVDDNFATTARRKETQYPTKYLETKIEEQLTPIQGKNPSDIAGLKTTYDTNDNVKMGEINENGDFEPYIGRLDTLRDKAIDALFEKNKIEGLLKLFMSGIGGYFFRPVGDDQRININDVIIEVDFGSSMKPKVTVTQTNDELDLKLISQKQFVQTSGLEGTKPVAKVASINRLVRSMDRYISRL
tara:strand:- start:8531 stop:9769 length:1239 start_codon:yes stop_codon:yes gene_type:complete